jgi:hypothetical protein
VRPADVFLALAFFAVLGLLIAAHVLLTRRVQRERDEAIFRGDELAFFAFGDASELATGYRCPHLSVTSGMGILRGVESSCGCTMQPVYAVRG